MDNGDAEMQTLQITVILLFYSYIYLTVVFLC